MHGSDGINCCSIRAHIYLIKGNTIFGSSVLETDSYALVSCVVSPGFNFKDFELFSTDQLISKFPNERAIIELLTP